MIVKKSEVSLEKDRLLYFDLLRIVSAFFVIMIHVAADGVHNYNVGTFYWNVSNVYDSIARFCVPVFVMISGTFLLDPKREYTLKKLFTNKIFRIIAAFLFWSLIYEVINLIKKTVDSVESGLYRFILNLFIGNFHLWFLFMICGLYMVTPILRKITADKKTMQYFLVLSFVFSSVIMFGKDLLENLRGFNGVLNLASEILSGVVGKLQLDFLLGYTFYYVLGFYIKEYGLQKKVTNWLYIAGICSVAFIVAGTYFVSLFRGKSIEILYSYNYLPVCLESAAIFVLFKNRVAKAQLGKKSVKIISFLSKYSFGIYLSHMLILENLPFNIESFNPVLSVPVITVMVFAGSLLISFGIGQIPVLKKYVI